MKKHLYILIWVVVLLFISCRLSIRIYPTINSKKTVNGEAEKDTIERKDTVCNHKNKKL
jgi:hypothetical protein